jgi:hypothetical protein
VLSSATTSVEPGKVALIVPHMVWLSATPLIELRRTTCHRMYLWGEEEVLCMNTLATDRQGWC